MKKPLFGSRRVPVVLSCFLMALGWAFVATAEESAAEESKALMAKRVAVLEELVALVQTRYQSGKASAVEVMAAENDLLDAKIEATTGREERIALLRKKVANLSKAVAIAESRYGNATVSIDEVLRARLSRLDAEIELARESEKPKLSQ